MIQTARETGAATHMFCAAGQQSTPQITEWIQAGAIGPVREVHNWSTRPFWPQGMTSRPSRGGARPGGPRLGPLARARCPHRPYHPAYTNAVFRGWYDFGTGALGDMGHYSFFQIFKILKLGSPLTRRGEPQPVLEDRRPALEEAGQHGLLPAGLAHPLGVPGAGGDAARRAPLVRRRPAPAEAARARGGRRADARGGAALRRRRRQDPGRLHGRSPRLIPKARMQAFQPPPQTLPRPADELEQWIRACRGTAPSDASFENVAAISETILLGHDRRARREEAALGRGERALRRRARGRRADEPAPSTARAGSCRPDRRRYCSTHSGRSCPSRGSRGGHMSTACAGRLGWRSVWHWPRSAAARRRAGAAARHRPLGRSRLRPPPRGASTSRRRPMPCSPTSRGAGRTSKPEAKDIVVIDAATGRARRQRRARVGHARGGRPRLPAADGARRLLRLLPAVPDDRAQQLPHDRLPEAGGLGRHRVAGAATASRARGSRRARGGSCPRRASSRSSRATPSRPSRPWR